MSVALFSSTFLTRILEPFEYQLKPGSSYFLCQFFQTSNPAGNGVWLFILHLFVTLKLWYATFLGYFGLFWGRILWLLLVIFALWIITHFIYLLYLWRWETNGAIGPITIEDVKDTNGASVLLRYYLSLCGAKCTNPTNTSSPSATPGFTAIKTDLEALGGEKASYVEAIVGFFEAMVQLLGAKKIGYTVSFLLKGPTVTKKDYSDSVEIRLTHTGSLLKSYSFEDEDLTKLIKKTAYWIFWSISGQRRALRNIPRWHRFPTFDSYCQFRVIEEIKDDSSKTADEIREAYQSAIESAPFNALVRLSYGDYLEVKNHPLEALEIYLEAVLMWPHLYTFLYRIAAIYSSIQDWKNDWINASPSYKEKLENLFSAFLATVSLDNTLPKALRNSLNKIISDLTLIQVTPLKDGDKKSVQKDCLTKFYKRSFLIWILMERQIRFMPFIWLKRVWINFISSLFNPIHYSRTLQKYYWSLVPFLGQNQGTQFLRSIQLANLCTIVQLRQIDDKRGDHSVEITRVDQLLKRPWISMPEIYTGACFYALISNGNDEFAVDANENLKIAYKDERTDLNMDWIRADPDLANLKKIPEFVALFDNKGEQEKEKNSFSKQLENKLHAKKTKNATKKH